MCILIMLWKLPDSRLNAESKLSQMASSIEQSVLRSAVTWSLQTKTKATHGM